MSSLKREAAERIFARNDGMSIADISRVVSQTVGPVSRQLVSRWRQAYEKKIKAPDTSAAKGLPAIAHPGEPRNLSVTEAEDRTEARLMAGEIRATRTAQPQPESLQSRPHMTLAERRANARMSILDDLRLGMHRKFAAARAGIARATFYAWLADPEWLAEVEASEADFAHRVSAVMNDEMQNGRSGQRWLPAMTAAERRFPEAFGRRSNVAVDIEVRGNLDVRRVVADPVLIDKITEMEMLYQGQELGAPVTALPPHVEDDE